MLFMRATLLAAALTALTLVILLRLLTSVALIALLSASTAFLAIVVLVLPVFRHRHLPGLRALVVQRQGLQTPVGEHCSARNKL